MGAENHSEVKVIFHKGLITIDESNGSGFPEAGLFYEAFEMAPTLSDSIDEAIKNNREAKAILSLLRHDPEAMQDGIFASNKYVLAAAIISALKLLVARLDTEDREEIVHDITDMAVAMFVRKWDEDPSHRRYMLEQNAKAMNKISESTVSRALTTILKIVVEHHPEEKENDDKNKKED